jgi:glutamate formiminotransferase
MLRLMFPVLEAVPNFSEGRDPAWLADLVGRVSATGVDVLDSSADPDHNRSVVTFIGDPRSVEEASLVAARHALEHIDLRAHDGVHPRVGALDVLPFVPLHDLTLADAVRSAHRTGEALRELGVPVYFYGAAARGPRRLAELRKGGFEAFKDGFPPGREPDLLPAGTTGAHPTAGVTCVGARTVLLAWNVYAEDVPMDGLKGVAAQLREGGAGGFRALRALAFELRTQGRRQISMNLEDLELTSPFKVFRFIEERVEALGGRITGTEVIGMIPDGLVLSAAEDRLHLLSSHTSRLLSVRLSGHIAARVSREVMSLLEAIEDAGNAVPAAVRNAAERLTRAPMQ